MGKAGKWLKSLLAGKKEDKAKKEKERQKEQVEKERETRSALISVPSSKEKRRWSFRRSGGAAGKDSSFSEPLVSTTSHGMLEAEMDQKRHVMDVAAATAAAAEAAIAAAQAAATVIRLTTKATESSSSIEETAAIQIQAAFRGYLARKALCGLKGFIKLQALVRGHLVRKQATTTLSYMQALVTAQERARVQRIRMLEAAQPNSKRQPSHRQSPQHPRQSFDLGRTTVENVKIVEMDHGDPRSSSKSRKSYSVAPTERLNHRLSSYSSPCATPKVHAHRQVSPSPSALTDMSARACSGHFEEFSFTTAQSSPRYLPSASMPVTRKTSFTLPQQDGARSMSNDYLFIPSYMANTKSSRAKSRSQSAPKQRPDNFERPSSRRRQTMEGRNTPRSGRMQGSSSHLSAIAQGYQYPWSIKLDKSSMSFKSSECGSTSTVLANTNYYSSLEAYEVYGCG